MNGNGGKLSDWLVIKRDVILKQNLDRIIVNNFRECENMEQDFYSQIFYVINYLIMLFFIVVFLKISLMYNVIFIVNVFK